MFSVTSSLLLNDKIFVVAIGSNSLTDNRRPSLIIYRPANSDSDGRVQIMRITRGSRGGGEGGEGPDSPR